MSDEPGFDWRSLEAVDPHNEERIPLPADRAAANSGGAPETHCSVFLCEKLTRKNARFLIYHSAQRAHRKLGARQL
jgi:hypothetical protein